MKINEVMIFGEMCVFKFMYLYIVSVWYAVSLLRASMCYLLTTRHVLYNNRLMLVFLSCISVLYFVYSMFLYRFVYYFSFCM
jgi:hypothetical protein